MYDFRFDSVTSTQEVFYLSSRCPSHLCATGQIVSIIINTAVNKVHKVHRFQVHFFVLFFTLNTHYAVHWALCAAKTQVTYTLCLKCILHGH